MSEFWARSKNFEKRLLASSYLSVLPLGFTGRIFMNFNIWEFFENMSRKFNFDRSLTTITGTLHEDLSTFMIVARQIVFKMTNFSVKSGRENESTYFAFNKFFDSRVVYGIMWKNIIQPDRSQMTKRRMRIACWISKPTNTISESPINILETSFKAVTIPAEIQIWYTNYISRSLRLGQCGWLS